MLRKCRPSPLPLLATDQRTPQAKLAMWFGSANRGHVASLRTRPRTRALAYHGARQVFARQPALSPG